MTDTQADTEATRADSEAPIRVLVVDDHAVVREGIRRVLTADPGFEVVGEASDAAEGMALAKEHHPDVVLLDIKMPGESGLELTIRLREAVPGSRVLILSMFDHGEYVLEAVRNGAHGYVLKDASPHELRNAVRAVSQGREFFSLAAARRMGAAIRDQHAELQASSALDLLTARERDVLVGVAEGLTNKEIGAKLGISHRTVESHRESLMKKLDIKTVAGLTRFALEQQLIEK
jgi:DNA-binding NarL/FixJ family response regulator